MTEPMKLLITLLPGVENLSDDTMSDVEEIRLCRGRKIRLCFRQREIELNDMVDEEILQTVLDRSTQRSPHAVMEMLRRGFLILPGGHRLGICGTGVYKDGRLMSLRDISSINIRVAKQIYGIGSSIADTLWNNPGSALVMGPPGRGKTTLLRDVIRQLSTRFRERIAVIDERLELAACLDGCAQFDLGPTSDILSAVGKAEGIDMLVRTMSPTWIALDEITAGEDVDAIIRGSYCGVRFLATAHGSSVEDLYSRPVYRKLIENHIFDYLYLIESNRSIRKEELCRCFVS